MLANLPPIADSFINPLAINPLPLDFDPLYCSLNDLYSARSSAVANPCFLRRRYASLVVL